MCLKLKQLCVQAVKHVLSELISQQSHYFLPKGYLQTVLSNACSAIIGLLHGDNMSNLQSSPTVFNQGSLCCIKPLGGIRKTTHQEEGSWIKLKARCPQPQRVLTLRLTPPLWLLPASELHIGWFKTLVQCQGWDSQSVSCACQGSFVKMMVRLLRTQSNLIPH